MFDKRIAFVTKSPFGPATTTIGGVGSIIRSVATESKRLGARPMVIVDQYVKDAPSAKRWVRDGIPVYRFPLLRSIPRSAHLFGKTRRRQLAAWMGLPRVLKWIRPDLIYFNVSGDGRLRFAYEIKRRLGSKIVGASHGLGGLVLHRGERFRAKDLHPFWIESVEAVDAWVPCGPNDERGLLSWGIPEEKVVPVYNGVFVPDELQPLDKPIRQAGRLRVVFAGRLIEEKGILELADAMVEVAGLLPDFDLHLCLAGAFTAGMDRIVEARLTRGGCRLDWEIPGEVPPEEVERLLLSSDIFCHPSRGPEGLPLSVLEAGAYGCPLVLSDIPAHRSVFEAGVHALFHRAGDASELALSIARLATDEELRLRLRANAHGLVKRRYNREKMLRRYMKLFDELLSC
ncbi:MAG: glycosyltransferase family 4 protein [Deltaproteobacteria bacterium]|nr:glycosyltransferase family 4 protein [Deltaproteobacteria bacterium]